MAASAGRRGAAAVEDIRDEISTGFDEQVAKVTKASKARVGHSKALRRRRRRPATVSGIAICEMDASVEKF